jgi:SAM-dependent methyltransferase
MQLVNRDFELQTHRAEERHWWYRGRRRVLERTIDRLALPPHAHILDAGCGSGRNMVDLARHGEVTGVELSHTSATLARARGVGEVVEGSVMDMPFAEHSFDMVVCLDVIEHLQDDRGALRELRRVLRPGGALLVTVPAYQWLWSGHDEVNHHHRRYSRATLQQAAREAGWECARTTHFNFLLLPVAVALRALDRLHARATESSLDLWVPPDPLNWLLQQPLNLEATLIGRGCHIPAGLSLLAVLVAQPAGSSRTPEGSLSAGAAR